jgi:hypothetical protein
MYHGYHCKAAQFLDAGVFTPTIQTGAIWTKSVAHNSVCKQSTMPLPSMTNVAGRTAGELAIIAEPRNVMLEKAGACGLTL